MIRFMVDYGSMRETLSQTSLHMVGDRIIPFGKILFGLTTIRQRALELKFMHITG